MQPERTRTIIAVFGSTESGKSRLAKDMGSVISRQGHILLTGGSGAEQLSEKERATVKEQAILGAQHSPWIGVTRDSTVPSYSIQRQGKAFVVQTDLNHKRNCLEACLCDGAIVLEGKKGTISEAVFSLWLGKPVVFVGDTWETYGLNDPADGNAKFTELVNTAFQLIGTLPSEHAPLDRLFDWNSISQHLKSKAKFMYFPSPTTGGEASEVIAGALKWLQESIVSSPRGHFPAIGRYAPVIVAYNKWVSTV